MVGWSRERASSRARVCVRRPSTPMRRWSWLSRSLTSIRSVARAESVLPRRGGDVAGVASRHV